MADIQRIQVIERPKKHGWLWFLSIGLVVAAVIAAGAVLLVANAVRKVLPDGSGTRTIREVDATIISDVLKHNKNVPLTVKTTVELERNDSYKTWGIYWGTNVAKVRAKNVKVQYAMDMGDLQPSDVRVDTSSDPPRLVVLIPSPHVDEDMVAIDPSEIEVDASGGWMRWDKAKTAADAVKDLKRVAIEQAKKEFLLDAAKAQGKKNIEELLKRAAPSSSKPYTIEVFFR